jgi:hypothetical protein
MLVEGHWHFRGMYCLIPKGQTLSQASITSFAYSSTLRKEAIHPSETSINFNWSTWCYIPADTIIYKEVWLCNTCNNLNTGKTIFFLTASICMKLNSTWCLVGTVTTFTDIVAAVTYIYSTWLYCMCSSIALGKPFPKPYASWEYLP